MTQKSQVDMAEEVMLELVQLNDGEVALRKSGDDEALVTIKFSQKIQQLLGDKTQMVSQQMIHAALYMLAEDQVSKWHAKVLDEKPKHLS